MPTEAGLETAKENVRNLFFSLAFDPDNREAAELADKALRELDRMLDAVDATGTAGQ